MKIKYILLFLMAWVIPMNSAYAQQTVTASGSVMDEKGEVLIGVSVSVKEVPSMGTITDIDGRFRIAGIKNGNTLLISYVGYDTQEIRMTKSNERMRVVLTESSNVMDEVVITASGKVQKKINVTGAITGVEVATLKTPATSVSNMLGGRVPGIISVTSSGEPGKDFSEFWVRGISTFGAGAGALVLIDGIEGNLNTLDPEDIESFSILKDASSTAVYGVRGANGVVLVTTKQAKEGKARIEYSGSYTYKMVGLQPELMTMNEWANAVLQTCQNDGQPDSYSWVKYAKMALANEGKYIDLDHSANPFAPSYSDVMDFVFMDTNWQDVLFGNSYSTQHDLAVSGGTEKNLYRLSVGYMYDDSNLKWGNNNNQRFNLRLTNKLKVFDNFSIESVIAYNRQDQVAPSQLNRTLTSSYPQPGLPASTIDGKPYSWGTWLSPIWFAELGGDNKLKVSEINISEKFTYNINKHLDVVANLGYNSGVASRDIKKMAITSYNYAGTKINTKADGYKQEESSYEKTSSRTDFYSMAGYVDSQYICAAS